MPRRITITVEVEEQGANQYDWRSVAKSEFSSSVEMFAPHTAALAIITGASKVIGEADEKAAASAAVADQAQPATFDEAAAAFLDGADTDAVPA